MKIDGNSFLVTGGSSGLGAACVRRLAQQGAYVTIADVNAEDGKEMAGELGARVTFVHTDVTDGDSVEDTVNRAAQAAPLRGVVNCAGIAIAAKAVGREGPHSLQAFRKVIEVNLVGTFNVCRLAAAVMSKAEAAEEGERGVLINTASVAAFEGQIGQPAYAASKGGVVGLMLPLARELARYGIRVVTIAPGIFDTPMMAGLPEKARKSLGEQVPFPSRLGRPQEYAALALHVIENPMINGEVIRLDGALRMSAK